ncbi:MAG: DUF5050 domain-containing protein [Butyrivibrio sp.]|nr:DUF5050 domain-containing protein [Acetatifactor muris]MCM1558415.1 DUF5050 domain-containing protein [Butyrivibrio sp.]
MRKEIHFAGGIKLLCVLTAGVFLLSACGKTGEKDADGAILSTESDRMGTGTDEADFAYPYVAESEKGYYFWERVSPDQFYPRLMFMDRESGRVVPLCSRPDCTHEGMECNAYFRVVENDGGGVHKYYLQYYEGDLYAVGLSEDAYVSLFRIRADGSGEWEISAKLYRTDYAATGEWKTPHVLIHGGYVYFDDRYQKIQKLERMSIDGGPSEVLFTGDRDASAVSIQRIKSNGDLLFFSVMSYWNDTPENAEVAAYRYDPAAGQCSMVLEGFLSTFSVRDGFLYYSSAEGLRRYSIQDQTTELLVEQPMNVPTITLTRDYIILCDQWGDGGTLTFYDYEGKKITTVPNTLNVGWYFGGDSDMLFGECWDDYLSLGFLDLRRPVKKWQWEELKEN